MRESRTWEYIRQHKPKWLDIERFEVMHPPGGSDCLWTDTRRSPAIVGWLELKYCDINDKSFLAGHIPKLKPEQPMFLRRQAEKGLPSGILMRVGIDRWYLFRARPDHEWVTLMRSREAVASGRLLQSPIDFEHLVHVLQGW